MKKDQSINLYIPGGPWISGSYWDDFISFHDPSGAVSRRYVLINHEAAYSSQKKPLLDEQLLTLKNYILELGFCYNKVNIIAHSYGAWLILLCADSEVMSFLGEILLVDMPSDLKKPKKFSDLIDLYKSFPTNTNELFSKYFEKILPVYFERFDSRYVSSFKDVFMEGNENLLLGKEEISAVKEKLRNLDRFKLIYGRNDKLIDNVEFFSGSYILDKTGHFPMIEAKEKFSHLLDSLLQSK